LKLLTRFVASLAVVISLTACAAPNAVTLSPAAEYTYRHNDFDFRYAWKTSQTDKGIGIEGLIKNVRYPAVEDVEVRVSLLNKEKKLIAEDVTFPIPQTIRIEDYRSFEILLKNAKISEGDQLQFLVSYSISEGLNAYKRKSNFTVNAATGAFPGTAKKSDDEQW
jgi:hypothetical protein